MELKFEIVKNSNDGTLIDFVHEPDNLFTRYYKKGKYIFNESTEPYMGHFEDDLTFKKETKRLTAQAISNFGVKKFPQYSSYGWYKTLHTNESRVLIPISKKRSTYDIPQLNVEQTGTDITITITDNQTAYDYYRIVFRKQLFAIEFITSKKVLTIPKLLTGEYELSVIGYKDEDIVSKEMEEVEFISE